MEKTLEEIMAANPEIRKAVEDYNRRVAKKKPKPTKFMTHSLPDKPWPPPDIRKPSPILTTGSPKSSGKKLIQTHDLVTPTVEERTKAILEKVGKGGKSK